MHYILDGNNIIRHPLWQSGQKIDDREALLIFLKDYRRNHPSVIFTVAFDGWAELSSTHPGIKILWSCDDSADRIIIQKLHLLKQGAIIVSNDNEIRRNAKLMGFEVMKVEEFLRITDKGRKTSGKNQAPVASKIPYSRVPIIEKELKEHYEKNPPDSRIRKIRKKFQRFP